MLKCEEDDGLVVVGSCWRWTNIGIEKKRGCLVLGKTAEIFAVTVDLQLIFVPTILCSAKGWTEKSNFDVVVKLG